MKRTDQERIERELRRRDKQSKVLDRRVGARGTGEGATPAAYIADLLEKFHFDTHQIYNANGDDDVLEILMAMKEDLPEGKWDSVLRSAIRKTKVQEKDLAFNELKESLSQA